ncbi:MAG: permease-like cell division protein FtsX [Gammaproteobacteria bacterium]|nr:permease-like cell division protein FtsX [Gammaproteobacteria bacterium]
MVKARHQQPLARPSFKTRFRAYVRDHVRVLLFSLGKLYRTPFATTFTLLMIAVALALPACLYVLLNNLQTVTHKWDDVGQISLFLQTDISEPALKQLKATITKHELVENVNYISADLALSEFKNRSEFSDLLEGLPINPLPPTLVVTPINSAKQSDTLNKLKKEFQSLANVEQVQLDMQWLQRLQAITDIIRRAITAIGIMLGLSVLLVVGNSIRLDIENRRAEIEVTKLIGATDRFIRRPFLYGGMWFGLLGGILALLLVFIVLLVIRQPAQDLVSLYNSDFKLMLPSFIQSISLIGSSIFLGLFGSWLAVGHRIAKIQPS